MGEINQLGLGTRGDADAIISEPLEEVWNSPFALGEDLLFDDAEKETDKDGPHFDARSDTPCLAQFTMMNSNIFFSFLLNLPSPAHYSELSLPSHISPLDHNPSHFLRSPLRTPPHLDHSHTHFLSSP